MAAEILVFPFIHLTELDDRSGDVGSDEVEAGDHREATREADGSQGEFCRQNYLYRLSNSRLFVSFYIVLIRSLMTISDFNLLRDFVSPICHQKKILNFDVLALCNSCRHSAVKEKKNLNT